MATVAKILGQSKPSAVTDTLLYTVPSNTECQGSLICCNQSLYTDNIRIALVKSGETLDVHHYILFDTPLAGNGIFEKSFDIGAGDKVYVYSNSGTTSFTASGLEIS